MLDSAKGTKIERPWRTKLKILVRLSANWIQKSPTLVRFASKSWGLMAVRPMA
jgi:hypothetical protein